MQLGSKLSTVEIVLSNIVVKDRPNFFSFALTSQVLRDQTYLEAVRWINSIWVQGCKWLLEFRIYKHWSQNIGWTLKSLYSRYRLSVTIILIWTYENFMNFSIVRSKAMLFFWSIKYVIVWFRVIIPGHKYENWSRTVIYFKSLNVPLKVSKINM